MVSTKNQRQTIWIAGFATLLATFQLVIFNSYVVIFLQNDLLSAILIITVIISLRNLLQLFFRIPLGELSQILGRKPLILAGHFSYTIALTLMFLANSWFLVLFSVIFVALGMSAFWPSLFAYIGDITPDSFGESNGRIFQLSDIGAIISFLVSTILLNDLLWELRNLFALVAFIGILSGLVSILILPEGLDKKDRKQVTRVIQAVKSSVFSMISSLKEITFTNGLTQVYAFQFMLAFTEFMATTFIPVAIVAKAGYLYGDIAAIGFWAALGLVWFKPLLGRLTDRFNFIFVISITIIISCIAIMSFTLTNDFFLLIILQIILNGSIITGYTAENGETTRRAPVASRGTALGALGFYVSFGRTTSTLVLGPIWKIIGLIEVFYFTGFGVIIITVLLFLKTRPKIMKLDDLSKI